MRNRKKPLRKSVYLVTIGASLLSFFFNLSLNAQFADSQKTLDLINKEIVDHLIGTGDFSKEEDHIKLVKQFHVFEILSKEPIGLSRRGIFGFRAMGAPVETFILLKNGNAYEIVNLKELSNSLKKILKFLKRNNYSNNSIAAYFNEVIILYNDNRYGDKVKM